ncbi:MAG TPA: sugar phosphate isomerase/epimerase [Clostridiales bacterium]|jgi:sugar phosphate isomerase/epimerase|nr:sugar phosphate isomerase/epimerase [Clostridiales bacterium]
MKLGVLTVLFGNKTLKETVTYLKGLGVEAIEIGCGGYPGKSHCDPEVLLADEAAFNEFMQTIADSGLIVSALSCHGNMVHPDKAVADAYIKDFKNAILLAEKMGIDRINTFSGCPGDAPGAKYPNWVTCPWPEDFLAILDYQWNEVLIPFWKDMAAFAKSHNVDKIALEMHPGFCVYNPETLLRLRDAVGDIIGANYDPSHLVWQGMDPVATIRELKGAIHHVHAKDVKVDPYNTAKNGVLDTKHYGDEANRAWIFRSVGFGMDESMWRAIMSELVLAGYDHVVSIEHEDSLMSPEEGLEKAVALLKGVLIREGKPKEIWWA